MSSGNEPGDRAVTAAPVVTADAGPEDAARRRRVLVWQRFVLNPPVRLATRLGWVPGHVLVETVGRTTGRRRRTVVGAQLEGDTVWVVAEQGPHAGYVRNLVAEPRVRVCLRRRWRPGVARLAPEVDPERLLDSRHRPLHARAVRRFGTALRVVRIDLVADPASRPAGAARGGGRRRWWYRIPQPPRTERSLRVPVGQAHPSGAARTSRRGRHGTLQPEVEGVVAPGFEPVRDAFVANLTERRELGGAAGLPRRVLPGPAKFSVGFMKPTAD